MSTEIIPISQSTIDQLPQILGVGELVWKQLMPVHQGWIRLGGIKAEVFNNLTKFELEAQQLSQAVANLSEAKDLPVIQENLKLLKAKVAEMKDCRLQFTRMLDEKIITPSTLFEKRCEALVEPIVALELKVRIEVNKAQDEATSLQREKNALSAHIKNEWFRIAAEYRVQLKEEINKFYLGALEQAVPVEHIEAYKQELKDALPAVARSPFVKFERKLVSDADAAAIFKGIPQFDPAAALSEALQQVDEVFSLYENDLANAEAAMKAIQEEHNEEKERISLELTTEVATNTLIAQAETPLVLTGGKSKVKTVLIPAPIESEAAAIAVMAAMLKHWQQAKLKLKIKSWEKLSIAQMAKALADLKNADPKIEISNVTFIEDKK